ncbi:long-chain fatty acid--CoA ligase [Putridiphycobacter roseus]|uniref:Long-chain fatty acid--CoA ligase n=1 Tax=Putridiphycobacter roseus TaxID=2219161 RepID=A0A2W1NM50_9FLAO|nr:long-chain fatty acid--CoA ligase [Putridiphycobacter roseus]PZE16722.1 long-chain fatty acid--CoA ligase [Putridiphycobacter roseus]
MEKITRLFEIPYYQLKQYPQDIAFSDKVNDEWKTITTQQYIDRANEVSRGLIELGIQAGDKIAIISNNRSEWHICDIAIQQVGAIGVPVYPTISKEDYKFIFNNAEIKICIVANQELFGKVEAIQSEVASLQSIYAFENVAGAIDFKDLMKPADPVLDAALEKRKNAIKSDDLVTLIYTSGTTGNPKGVMLTHANIIANVYGSIPRIPVGKQHTAVSFLPVCHVYERMILYLYQILGISVYFAESMETLSDDLKDVKPHVFTAVPRLLEKVYDKIILKGDDLTGIKRKLFFWAVELGNEFELSGKSAFYTFKLKIARKLIFSKWQEALGGRVIVIPCGSAALQPRLARIFYAAGIPVLEGYGLTETSPVISVNYIGENNLMFGTTGKPLHNVEVKIAEDGEILAKGPNVMQGYYKNPEKTAEEFTADGWFKTGDIGQLEPGGFLKITDRKKEMFKTSGGKYIAPQVMENKFKESRFIEQIMVIGEGKKHPAALIVPSFDFIVDWCKRKQIKCEGTFEAIVANEKVIERIQREVDHYNEGFGNWEQIKKFKLVNNEWTVESGELTPTMKPKRKVVKAKYENLINEIYNA